jgi:hypothetical protein
MVPVASEALGCACDDASSLVALRPLRQPFHSNNQHLWNHHHSLNPEVTTMEAKNYDDVDEVEDVVDVVSVTL